MSTVGSSSGPRCAHDLTRWFLSTLERDNPDTHLDRRHANGIPWTRGNRVNPLIHGSAYFARLLKHLRNTQEGDLVLFTDWRGDPDEHLEADGPDVGSALGECARRGVIVRGLVWRSHWDRFQFSARENRHLGEEIEAAGGECRLDMRVRPMGSHHQKLVVLRHPGRAWLDVAYVGGIDLCHSRRDDATHAGDPQPQPMSSWYGPRPPWHDIQLEITGPAVGDVEATFRERWDDPTRLSRNPIRLVSDRWHGAASPATPLPVQAPDPEPTGDDAVQLLRTYPLRRPGYPFARRGERSIARGYAKALLRAKELVYLEDQYLWSVEAAELFAEALHRQRDLLLIAVIPQLPDQQGRLSTPPNLVSRAKVLDLLLEAGGDRVGVYGLENLRGVPVYVHAKVCCVDDTWFTVGSDNVNRRSWTHDSELTCAVIGEGEHQNPARDLRLRLAQEHLDLLDRPTAECQVAQPKAMFEAFAMSAERLDAWHTEGCVGARPAGRLRTYRQEHLGTATRVWASMAYRTVYDPDGRSVLDRMRDRY